MSESEDPKIREFVENAQQLLAGFPEQPPPNTPPLVDKELLRPVEYCPNCKCLVETAKRFQIRTWASNLFFEQKRVSTPNVVDPLCDKCNQASANMCRVVCLNCMEVVARFAPWKDGKTGFAYQAGHYYHVLKCPKCAKKGEAPSRFYLEFQTFCKQKGIQL